MSQKTTQYNCILNIIFIFLTDWFRRKQQETLRTINGTEVATYGYVQLWLCHVMVMVVLWAMPCSGYVMLWLYYVLVMLCYGYVMIL